MNEEVKKIGRYEVIKTIGEGGFGKVYLVKDRGKHFALKKLESSMMEPQISYRFFQEADRIEKIRKKYKLYYLVQIIEILYKHNAYVMEYVEEESSVYFNRCKNNDFLIQLIQAIQQLHSLDTAHRDLKPPNIRVKNSRLILIDFGIASWWDSNSNIIPMGTKAYSPPEMVSVFKLYQGMDAARKANEELSLIKDVNYASRLKYIKKLHDVYSLGITIGELLTGELPFLSNSPDFLEYLDKGESTAFETWLAKIPTTFRDFVKLATTFSPLKRPQLNDLMLELGIGFLTELIYDFDDEDDTVRPESVFKCLSCSKTVTGTLDKCPFCQADLAYLMLHIEPRQSIVTKNLPPSIWLTNNSDYGPGNLSIVIDLNGNDFDIRVGRAPENNHIAFIDDNWMSNAHGILIKKQKKVYYLEGYEGKFPTNRSLLNNIPIGDSTIELLSDSILLLGSIKFKIYKYFGNLCKTKDTQSE